MESISKKSGIYQIRNLVNGKVYVGSAVNLRARMQSHFGELKNNKHNNRHLQRAYDKYGLDKFVFEVLEYVEKDMLLEREQYYIDTLNAVKEGYNLSPTAGSLLGFKLSEEAKTKISKGNKGKKRSAECIKQIRERNLGRRLTEEQKAKISAKTKGALNGNYGRMHTKEARAIMFQRASGGTPWNKGEEYTEEEKQRMREYNSNRGKKFSEIPRAVKCVETQQVFPSIVKAAEWAGLKSRAGISACCNGHALSAGGYHWEFV